MVRSAVQAERRSQISKLVDIFPLKWIVREDGGERTVSLAQVQSFLVAGVLQDDALKDVEAALSFLLPLVSLLAVYLDVALPFPCAGASGRPGQVLVEIQAWTDNVGEPCRSGFDQRPRAHTEPTASAPSMNRSQIQSECGGAAAQSAWWTRPCVLHPFTGIWFNFSIYDGICTAEFMTALRLLDQNLRKLCMSQGVVPPLDSSTLQLLASCLSATHLGCVSPPLALHDVSSASVSQADESSLGASSMNASCAQVCDSVQLTKNTSRRSRRLEQSVESSIGGTSAWEDGEWTVVE